MEPAWTIIGFLDFAVLGDATTSALASNQEDAERARVRSLQDCGSLARSLLRSNDQVEIATLVAELSARPEIEGQACIWWAGDDARYRALAVALLAQTDVELSEKLQIVRQALVDSDARVLSEGIVAAIRVAAPQFTGAVTEQRAHSSSLVRVAIAGALALPMVPRTESVKTLQELTADTEVSVRRWASFGLAQCIEIPSVSDILTTLLADVDAEVRGEALIGLAEARDPRSHPAIISELARRPVGGTWVLRAVGENVSRSFVEPLLQARSAAENQAFTRFVREADVVLEMCRRASDGRC